MEGESTCAIKHDKPEKLLFKKLWSHRLWENFPIICTFVQAFVSFLFTAAPTHSQREYSRCRGPWSDEFFYPLLLMSYRMLPSVSDISVKNG